jgi:N6-adenosine-specific RNA methylase IME4
VGAPLLVGQGHGALAAGYDGLTIEQMCALPVKDLFAADAALFMWVLDAFLLPNKRYKSPGCYAVFEAWEFEYSGIAFHWVKTGARLAKQEPLFIVADNKDYPRGLGPTTRKGAEVCLLGACERRCSPACLVFPNFSSFVRSSLETALPFVRGKFGRDRKDVSQVLLAPRARHSEKPIEQYTSIEQLMGGGPYLVELFSRRRREGWEVALSPEADSGPGKRRWRSDSFPTLGE